MNKGPISRMQKVPVKCKNCGKIKHNVVYTEQNEEPKPPIEKKAEEKPVVSSPPSQPKTHYIGDIVAHQMRLAEKYSLEE